MPVLDNTYAFFQRQLRVKFDWTSPGKFIGEAHKSIIFMVLYLFDTLLGVLIYMAHSLLDYMIYSIRER